MWWDCKVDSQSFSSFIFCVNKSKAEFKIRFDVSVSGNGLDVRFVLCTYKDFQKLTKWMKNKTKLKQDSNGQVVRDENGIPTTTTIPEPQIQPIFEIRKNSLDRTVDLSSGKYALLLDNTYSAITGKNLDLHVVETWKKENDKKDLPIVQCLNELPSNIVICINDANDCYVAGHYNQCTVMLRKGIELALKTKLLQSGMPFEQLLDKTGNELGLSSMIQLLKKKKLLTAKNSSDIERIKWFGDAGAHKTMRITEQDIKDNIEPKIRSLFAYLWNDVVR